MTVVVLRSGVPADTKPKTWVAKRSEIESETLEVARARAPEAVCQAVCQVVCRARWRLCLILGVPSCPERALRSAELP